MIELMQTALLTLNIVIDHAINNARRCANNTRDLNRTQMMAETARHQHKYSDPLTQHHAALAEDVALIMDAYNLAKVSFFRDRISSQTLDDIYSNWRKIGTSMVPYRNIAHDLLTIKRQVNRD